MSPYQAGRLTQRLLEMETYRIMALLALPVAQEVAPQIGTQERELAEISAALVEAQEADEPLLLQRLTRMAAEAESRESRHRFRFLLPPPITNWCATASRNCANCVWKACRLSVNLPNVAWRQP